MPKITFMGAGSTVFARNVLGDCMCTPSLCESEIALYDIDAERLEESYIILSAINKNTNGGKATLKTYCGVENRKEALRGADFVVNAIQVGFYDPCTIIDFEVPKKYGLRQTIADTMGIGGIMRALRTIPVLEDFARDMEEVCPNAWFLNYTNPMAMLSGYMQRYTNVKTVGLCHSVQVCSKELLKALGMEDKVGGRRGYYCTESSEHNAEYNPLFIKSRYPELIEQFNIPLDEYPRRCINQIKGWKEEKESILKDGKVEHTRSSEYASYIMEAMVTGNPYKIGGNVLNTGLIDNLPADACVEVPCLVDKMGVNPCHVGRLPVQLAAMNMTNINAQLMTIEAARTRKREDIYRAAMLDPHTAAELSIDDIVKMCDDLIEAHGDYMAMYK